MFAKRCRAAAGRAEQLQLALAGGVIPVREGVFSNVWSSIRSAALSLCIFSTHRKQKNTCEIQTHGARKDEGEFFSTC
jgi:hypothetical protein